MTLITIQPNGTIPMVRYGDNSSGNNADLFPNDSSEWYDSDGDGTETTLTTSSMMEVNKQILMVTGTEIIQTEQMVTNMQTIHYVGLTEMVMDTVTRKMTHSHRSNPVDRL